MTRYRATMEERGNGFGGQLVAGDDGELYRIVSESGTIHAGPAGSRDYYHAIVDEADWDTISDDEEPICSAVIGDEVPR